MSLFRPRNKENAIEKKKRRLFKTPIALHFYSAFTAIILFFFISINVGYNRIYNSYIESECSGRIDNAIKSVTTYSEAYRATLDASDFESPTAFRNEYFNLIISSTNVSTDASMALFYEADGSEDNEYVLLWPNPDSYSYEHSEKTSEIMDKIKKKGGYNFSSQSYVNKTSNILKKIIENKGIQTQKVKHILVNDKTYYYKFVKLTYDANDENIKDNYYLLFYIDASNYYSLGDKLNSAMFNTMIITIIIAGVLSIIISFPIISSSRRLSKFANRISKGDFAPYKGIIVSRELNELSETMNQMANKLEESDKEQKTFFQNASHELRTPLMSIQGYAEGMKYDIFDKDEAVDIIISETSRLSNMVENLLTISKMDLSASNSYQVKKTIVDVYELLGVTIDKVRGGFIHENKELINDIKIKSNVHIYANENDIFRMLENVFSNCLRYAKKNVWFNCYTENDKVIFEISDDGPGISDEVMSHLFDRFAKGSDGKHGIGLALVKAIATEHGGKVTAGNKEEGGAIFRIKLPTVTANEQLSHQNKTKDV